MYEQNIAKRYKDIANWLNLEFQTIKADSVEVVEHSELSKKYIHSKILKNSNYSKGEWCDEWDNLYQSFIKRNKTKLQKYKYYFKGI